MGLTQLCARASGSALQWQLPTRQDAFGITQRKQAAQCNTNCLMHVFVHFCSVASAAGNGGQHHGQRQWWERALRFSHASQQQQAASDNFGLLSSRELYDRPPVPAEELASKPSTACSEPGLAAPLLGIAVDTAVDSLEGHNAGRSRGIARSKHDIAKAKSWAARKDHTSWLTRPVL